MELQQERGTGVRDDVSLHGGAEAMLAPAIDLESDTEVQRHRELLPELASRSGAECKTAVPPTRRWGRCFSGTAPGTTTTQRSCDPGPYYIVRGDDVLDSSAHWNLKLRLAISIAFSVRSC